MCGMCESDNYDALLELQARYYYLNDSTAATQSTGPTEHQCKDTWNSDQYRRGSLSTCFNNLHIQRTHLSLPSITSRRMSTVNMSASNPTPPAFNLLSPPSSPKTPALSLTKVAEVDEYECDHITGNNQEGRDTETNEPCRRFQRQILSRIQALGPQAVDGQTQDPRMLMVIASNPAEFGDHATYGQRHRFTPPPSPDPHDQRQFRNSMKGSRRPSASAPSSRKGSTAITSSRPTKIRLPSLAELELGILPTGQSTQRLTGSTLSASCTINSARRRVSSPNPSSYLGARGGIKKLGCGRKSSVEVLGDDTPFKSGWSFSTAYGKGRK